MSGTSSSHIVIVKRFPIVTAHPEPVPVRIARDA